MLLLRLNHQLKEFSVLQGFRDTNTVVKPGWSAALPELVTLTDCLNVEKNPANRERSASGISPRTGLFLKNNTKPRLL